MKAVHPDIYHTYFDEHGQIRSGLEASRLSFQGFTQKLSTGNLSDLGFPLFSFVISLVTSGVVIAKVIVSQTNEQAIENCVERSN